jgi:nitroreductase
MAVTEPATTAERPLLDTLAAIRKRRALKEYLDTPIPKEWIEELLDAAHWAPNHKLNHPWRFHVFTGEGREKLVGARQAAVRWGAEQRGREATEEDLEFARKKCYSAPVIIIVSMVGDENPIVDRENYAACWAAIENLLLAATARGLGSYPSTGDWIDQNFVGPVLGLTENERPVSCIFVGYSDQEIAPKRFPVERHTKWYSE